ncbi:MAG: hypothetical protein CM15mP58_18790 [Burkholderiaceae bacterium]|nr:MAG: hypothetical protein CM15mP58_18790 [Burkholderiaceae bacterium]
MLLYLEKVTIFCSKGPWRKINSSIWASKEISVENQGLTAVEKIFNKMQWELPDPYFTRLLCSCEGQYSGLTRYDGSDDLAGARNDGCNGHISDC